MMTKLGHFGTRLCLDTEKQARTAATRGDPYLQWRELRFNVALEVQVEGLLLSTSNISLSGMQVVCPAARFDALPSKLGPQALSATLTVPPARDVNCTCKVVYVTDNGNEYLIGMKFEDFEEGGQEVLREFLPKNCIPELQDAQCSISQTTVR